MFKLFHITYEEAYNSNNYEFFELMMGIIDPTTRILKGIEIEFIGCMCVKIAKL